MKKKWVVGVADCSKYINYERWMLAEPDIEVVRLGYQFEKDSSKCDGILLTGGEDVHPAMYGKPEFLSLCENDNLDERRDEFELSILKASQRTGIPVLGICRGLQITNVFYGGTLLPDIPFCGKPDHAKVKGVDRNHTIKVEHGSLLSQIVGYDSGKVNSAHHQSADRFGEGLAAGAWSEDGIVESLEPDKGVLGPYLLLVQWHPERMGDQDSPFVKNIKHSFLNAVRNKN